MEYGNNRLVLVYDSNENVVEYRNFTNTADAHFYANERCARGYYAVTTKPSPEYV